jgi:murein DD-endopeptidase MepM/ murein hydrolase activator NlpD
MVLRVYGQPGITYATAYFAGVAYTMLPYGDRWSAVIGLPTWQPIGGYPLEVVADTGTIASGWVDVSDGGFAYEDIELPPEVGGLLQDTARIEEERILVSNILAGFTPEKYWSGPWIMPAQGSISNAFGLQRSFNGGPYSPHTGTDIANEHGTPIYASASGVVAYASALYLYGNSVIIDHGIGVFSTYNHMDSLVVAQGQFVNQGDLIGYMGSTGFSTGPHVHWEADVHGVRTDPMLWTQIAVEP